MELFCGHEIKIEFYENSGDWDRDLVCFKNNVD